LIRPEKALGSFVDVFIKTFIAIAVLVKIGHFQQKGPLCSCGTWAADLKPATNLICTAFDLRINRWPDFSISEQMYPCFLKADRHNCGRLDDFQRHWDEMFDVVAVGST
jgi:hypothetical protein